MRSGTKSAGPHDEGASSGAPLVSIGLATYNRADFLPRTLDSILAQTHENIEIVLSDDASTDETARICEEYAARDSRIRYVCQPQNLGFFGNWEYVLQQARGVYFMWSSDDDVLHPRFVERTVGFLEDHPDAVLCFCDYEFIDEQDVVTGSWGLNNIHPNQPWPVAQRDFFRYPFWRSGVAVHGMYRFSSLRAIGSIAPNTFRRLMSGCEAPFLARVASRGRIVALPETLFKYREHHNTQRALAYVASRSLRTWELVLLYLTIQSKLMAYALSAHAPVRQRLRLGATCFAAFLRKAGTTLAGRRAEVAAR